MIYDVIGDVHGQADKLIGLLTQLGYQHDGQCFQAPPNHQAIFIGAVNSCKPYLSYLR